MKPCGKQTVKQLVGQDQGVANIEITDRNIKDFERIARKYGVDFALKKDRTGEIPKYLVFFKARDGDALTAAFKEYTAKTDRKREHPSVIQKLRKFKEQAASIDTPKVRKNLEYGSARWGTAADIAPFVDPVFENNVILTQTKSLMMSNRPKDPKNARNKNVLVIGGSGSGKTRFFLKPNLMQLHSSYVVTDPNGYNIRG